MSLERLWWLRYQFSDEIPNKVLYGDGKYKVRTNWWQGLVAELEIDLKKGAIPEHLRYEVESFVEHYTSKEFHRQRRTKKKDIKRANELLDEILRRNQG